MKKPELYGIIGSAIFCGLVLLMLLLIVMPGRPIPEDEGIIVSFGNSSDGGGEDTPADVSTPVPVPPAEQPQPDPPAEPARPEPTPPASQDLLTQDDLSLALAQQQEEEARRQKEQEEQRRREEEAARLAEQKRKEQEAIEKAGALSSMFGAAVPAESSGTEDKDARQGNPVGKGVSEGHSWSLDGRSLVGRLARPAYESNVEGIITVDIRVDDDGRVTHTSIGRPTTISDAATQKATLEAARKTKFSAGKNIAAGTITYNFKLK